MKGGCRSSTNFHYCSVFLKMTGQVCWCSYSDVALTPVVAIGATTSHANQIDMEVKAFTFKSALSAICCLVLWRRDEICEPKAQYPPVISAVYSIVWVYTLCTVNSELYPQDYAGGFVCFRPLTTNILYCF